MAKVFLSASDQCKTPMRMETQMKQKSVERLRMSVKLH